MDQISLANYQKLFIFREMWTLNSHPTPYTLIKIPVFPLGAIKKYIRFSSPAGSLLEEFPIIFYFSILHSEHEKRKSESH